MEKSVSDQTTPHYDVAIIGGGAAGLSAAQALGRSLRKVLVIDAGNPRNAPAHAMHNFLSRDGMNPLELLAVGREELGTYDVDIVSGTVLDIRRTEQGFELSLPNGTPAIARRVILAAGLRDILPVIDGVKEHWGNNVLHCPYCHGWEVRGKQLGINDSDFAAHQALMFTQWSDSVTLFKSPQRVLGTEETEQLLARGVHIVEGTISSILGTADSLSAAVLTDGSEYPIEALVIMPKMEADLSAVASLGLEISEHPMGLVPYVEVDVMGQSPVPGLWVAGSLADPKMQVIMAAASGLAVGAAVNADLMAEETRAAVELMRATTVAR
ncbi:thioredoxin reductase [Arthrobacter sp. MYb227]|uniref:NAD(P)/FAD-dependent oxidoreductase n=1 Tax=Arthrobacter sp. MYb227 TaxID=1848601 RepID=UPI000CFC5874|nr:NAD(P)/FAD-dependent oxidoreductase [Arthrobacter sp. MYb227]PQZ93647.1 thioredoxin reductase [Arthrobacter sp. MYb227]